MPAKLGRFEIIRAVASASGLGLLGTVLTIWILEDCPTPDVRFGLSLEMGDAAAVVATPDAVLESGPTGASWRPPR